MQNLKLVIGNKNYSSWSLRPWLLLRQFGLGFEEIRVPLSQPDTREKLRPLSPSLRVPVLHHEALVVWDTLAICEYVSERFLDGKGWPMQAAARAWARSVSAEMHAGFSDLRSQWPMNCRLQRPLEPDAALAENIARIDAIWSECLTAHGPKGWLFGAFSIADCMYAPVVLRFYSYQPGLSDLARGYVERMLANEHIQAWMEAGKAEAEVIREDEVGYILGEPEWQN